MTVPQPPEEAAHNEKFIPLVPAHEEAAAAAEIPPPPVPKSPLYFFYFILVIASLVGLALLIFFLWRFFAYSEEGNGYSYYELCGQLFEEYENDEYSGETAFFRNGTELNLMFPYFLLAAPYGYDYPNYQLGPLVSGCLFGNTTDFIPDAYKVYPVDYIPEHSYYNNYTFWDPVYDSNNYYYNYSCVVQNYTEIYETIVDALNKLTIGDYGSKCACSSTPPSIYPGKYVVGYNYTRTMTGQYASNSYNSYYAINTCTFQLTYADNPLQPGEMFQQNVFDGRLLLNSGNSVLTVTNNMLLVFVLTMVGLLQLQGLVC